MKKKNMKKIQINAEPQRLKTKPDQEDISKVIGNTIGSRLKRARLEQGITFEEIYNDLKIHPNIVRALEEDNIDPGIGDIYIKGFLKKYAIYLGFKEEDILSEYSQSALLREPQKDIFANIDKETHTSLIIKGGFEKSVLSLTAAIAFIFTVSVIIYAGSRLIREVRKIPPAFSKTLAEKKKIKVAEPSLLIPKSQPLVLKIETKDNVWLRVKSDGKIIFEHTLPKGSIESWNAKDTLELRVGRAEALDLTLNNKRLGSPGSGLIRKIVIDHEGLRVEKK